MNCEKYLLLDVKKLLIIVGSFILAVILHNFVSGLLGGIDEPVFFIIAVIIIPIYFLTAVGYTIFHHVKKRMKK